MHSLGDESSLLLERDDGLRMRESGAWTALKLDYVSRYIGAFETAMRDKWRTRNYVDLLAGPGKARVRRSGRILLGSPLIALCTEHPFTGYYFSDLDNRNTQALDRRCAASALYQRVRIRTGDCNELVASVVGEITGKGKSLNLAFLDPEGYCDLHWETVAALASVPKMDLIVHYPEYALNRNMKRAWNSSADTAVDRFFGGCEWRDVYKDCLNGTLRGGVHRHLSELYKDKLAGLGYDAWRGDDPLIRNIAKAARLYRLLFASKHPLGKEIWGKILQRDAHGQIRLFWLGA